MRAGRIARIAWTGLVAGLVTGACQPCPQGNRSIEQAVRVAASGDLPGARKLLDRAAVECPTSFPIFLDLAKKYRMLGDTQKAEEADWLSTAISQAAGLTK